MNFTTAKIVPCQAKDTNDGYFSGGVFKFRYGWRKVKSQLIFHLNRDSVQKFFGLDFKYNLPIYHGSSLCIDLTYKVFGNGPQDISILDYSFSDDRDPLVDYSHQKSFIKFIETSKDDLNRNLQLFEDYEVKSSKLEPAFMTTENDSKPEKCRYCQQGYFLKRLHFYESPIEKTKFTWCPHDGIFVKFVVRICNNKECQIINSFIECS